MAKKKSNNLILIIAFLILAGVFGAYHFLDFGKNERSFRSEFFSLDTALVNKITLYPKNERHVEVVLKRADNGWLVSREGAIDAPVQSGKIKNTLTSLTQMKPSRVVANKQAKWADYEIEEGVATHVIVETSDGEKADFYVGKYSINQQTQASLTYIRVTGENEVYAANGFFNMAFDQSHDQWRDNRCMTINDYQSVSKVDFSYPKPIENFSLQKQDDKWLLTKAISDSNVEETDKTKVENYLRSLAIVNGTFFLDGFKASNEAKTTLTVEAGGETYTVDSYEIEPNRFAVIGSQYPNNIFRTDSNQIIKRVFKQPADFQ